MAAAAGDVVLAAWQHALDPSQQNTLALGTIAAELARTLLRRAEPARAPPTLSNPVLSARSVAVAVVGVEAGALRMASSEQIDLLLQGVPPRFGLEGGGLQRMQLLPSLSLLRLGIAAEH